MTTSDFLLSPFADFAFMRRALAACVILAIGGTPLGVFMSLRRMTLVGDAMSHAILPGVALAFLFCGFSVWPMTLGGIGLGVLVALLAIGLTRVTQLKEDASFTLIYLVSLAAGVAMISVKGNSLDLMHLLFGNILAIDNEALGLISSVSCLSILVILAFYRSLVIDCFDPSFAAAHGKNLAPLLFFVLLVVNLIAAFQALGTLMALGLMLLPSIAARFWTRNIDLILPLAILFALISAPIGLLISFYAKLPSGPAVVLVAGGFCFASVLLGRTGSIRAYFRG
jgi:zinc/manganese transport system permease protein